MKQTILQRFEEKYIPEPNSGCWLWIGTLDYFGYGVLHVKRKNIKAHRVSYALHKGPTIKGLEIQHSCDVRCCVNPDHLSQDTHAKNMRSSALRKRHPNRKGEKAYWAKLTAENVLAIRATTLIKRGDQTNLAKKYGVTHNTIRMIKDFKTWTDL